MTSFEEFSKHMFIIYIIDLSAKNKRYRRGFIFLQKSKLQIVKNRKIFFSVILFQKFLIFRIFVFSENAQCFVGTLL